jgi:hypothetical protein
LAVCICCDDLLIFYAQFAEKVRWVHHFPTQFSFHE